METEIKTPDWVPPIVTQCANYLVAHAPHMPPETEAVLIRLVTDERMREVWEEVGKHKRINYKSTPEHFYDPQLPAEVRSWSALAEAWRREAKNLRSLGDEAAARQFEDWAQAVPDDAATSATPPTNEQQHDMAKAILLCDAFAHVDAGLRTVRMPSFEKFLEGLRAKGQAGVADTYERLAAEERHAPYLVSRQRTDARIQAFVIGLGAVTRAMFGSPLYGVLATLVNVAFEGTDLKGGEYDQRRIRALLR